MTVTDRKMAPGARCPINCAKNPRAETKNTNTIKIGTWNVRILYDAGRLNTVLSDMQRMNVHILGMCEAIWPYAPNFLSGEPKHYTHLEHEMDHIETV